MVEWTTVKKGWVYQRKRTLKFITNWSPKYLVLYSAPIPALAIYEQRSDATPPYAPLLHIDLQGLQIGPEQTFSANSTNGHASSEGGKSLSKWTTKLKNILEGNISNSSAKSSRKGSTAKAATDFPAAKPGHKDVRSNSIGMSPPSTASDLSNRLLYIIRPATLQHSAQKLCFAMNSKEERDLWVTAIRQASTTTLTNQEKIAKPSDLESQASIFSYPQSIALPPENRAADPYHLSVFGMTFMDSTIVERLLSTTSKANQNHDALNDSSDSITTSQIISESTGDIMAVAIKPPSVPFTASKLNDLFQRAIAARRITTDPDKLYQLELEAFQAISSFHTLVAEKAVTLLDEYHIKKLQPKNGQLDAIDGEQDHLILYEEPNGLCIQMIADYNYVDSSSKTASNPPSELDNATKNLINNDNQDVCDIDEDALPEAATNWLRQEMQAVRWINRQTKGKLCTSLLAVMEYKGFRVMGHVSSNQTIPLWDLEAGIAEESIQEELKLAAEAMNLSITYPVRLYDGRLVQAFLHPSLKIHQSAFPMLLGGCRETQSILVCSNLHDLILQWPESIGYFRPELIQTHSSLVALGQNQQEKACQMLRTAAVEKMEKLVNDLNSLSILPLDSRHWTIHLHSYGLNCNLLGAIAKRAILPHIREALIIEMIARTVKKVVAGQLRRVVFHFRQVRALRIEEELTSIVLNIFNAILTGPPSSSWLGELANAVSTKYSYPLEAGFMTSISRPALFFALQHHVHCGVIFSDEAVEKVYQTNGQTLIANDLEGFTPRLDRGSFDTDSFALSTYGEQPFILTEQSSQPATDNINKASYELARELWLVSEAGWRSPLIRANLAYLLLNLVKALGGNKELDAAQRYIKVAEKLAPCHHAVQALIELTSFKISILKPETIDVGGAVCAKLTLQRATIITEEAARVQNIALTCVDRHFGSNHPLAIIIKVQIASILESLSKDSSPPSNPQLGTWASLPYYKEALVMSHKVLGRSHPITCYILSKLGNIELELAEYDSSIAYFSEALKTLCSDGSEQSTLLMKLCDCFVRKGEPEKALEYAKKALCALDDKYKPQSLTQSPSPPIISGQGRINTACHLVLERIADLVLSIYDQTDDVLGLQEGVISETMTEHLREALFCYERIFEELCSDEGLETNGQQLARLLKHILCLRLRLAKPAQKTIIRAIHSTMSSVYVETVTIQDEENLAVRDMLVKLLTGIATPKSHVDRILEALLKDQSEEACRELQILFQLIKMI